MAKLTKERARAPIADNKPVWTRTSYQNNELCFCVTIRGNDGKDYELVLEPSEMLTVVSALMKHAENSMALVLKARS